MNRSRSVPALLIALLAAVAAGATCNEEPVAPGSGGEPPAAGTPVVRDGVEYRADVAVMESFPVQLAGRMTAENGSGSAVDVTFPDGCVALLRAYRDGERVWDQASEVACTMALVEVTLAPGEERTFRAPTASAADVLDEGLPDGEYEIRVYVRPDGSEVEVSGGTVDLAIPRD